METIHVDAAESQVVSPTGTTAVLDELAPEQPKSAQGASHTRDNRRNRRKQEALARKSNREEIFRIYTRVKSGIERIRILHPTKGYRDYNMSRYLLNN